MAGKSLNRVQLIGNLGKDPEIKYTPQGTPVAKLTIATNERFKDKGGEWQDRTEWHNVVLWQRLAEIAGEYLKKGGKVYVEGRLQTRSWDDKQTGQKKYMTEVVASDLILLGGGRRRWRRRFCRKLTRSIKRKQFRSAHSGTRASRRGSDYRRGHSLLTSECWRKARKLNLHLPCQRRPARDFATADSNRRQTPRVRSAGRIESRDRRCPAPTLRVSGDSAVAFVRSAGSKQSYCKDR